MNIFRKKLFFILVSFVLFLFSANLVNAGDIRGICGCGICREDVAVPLVAQTVAGLNSGCIDACNDSYGCAGSSGEITGTPTCVVEGESFNATSGCTAEGEEETTGTKTSEIKAIQLESPITDTELAPLIGRIIKTALGLVGALALLMFICGGLIWLTSGGSPDKIKKGMDVLMWAAIGLVVIFAGYTLVDFVFTALGI